MIERDGRRDADGLTALVEKKIDGWKDEWKGGRERRGKNENIDLYPAGYKI